MLRKVVIAIDSFKGCLTSQEAGEAAARGVRRAWPGCQTLTVPVADGGEGWLEALVNASGGSLVSVRAHDPLMEVREACYGLSRDGQTAFVEMARISGLPLVPEARRNPLLTRQYERILKDLRNANPNMEIIAILPHHTSEGRNIDGNDDRPYISQLREFCIRHNLVFADVSLRYSRLHRQGIPPMLLMVNNHNHPLKEGMKLFSDTLLELFPEK